MSVIAHFGIPADQFPLGEVLAVDEDVRVRLETMIPTGADVAPFFWVPTEEAAAVETVLRDSPSTDSVRALDRTDGETLFRVDWDTAVDGLVEALEGADAVVLEGEGRGDTWHFRVRFPAHDALSAFYGACLEEGVDVDLTEVNNPLGGESGAGFGLTGEQRETLRVALEAGYFDVPREATLLDLAERLEVSDSAVSQRIRRGLGTLLSATLAGTGPDRE